MALYSSFKTYTLHSHVWESAYDASQFVYLTIIQISSHTLPSCSWSGHEDLYLTARRLPQVNPAPGFSEGHWVQSLCVWPQTHHSVCMAPNPSFYVNGPKLIILCVGPQIHHSMCIAPNPTFYVYGPEPIIQNINLTFSCAMCDSLLLKNIQCKVYSDML